MSLRGSFQVKKAAPAATSSTAAAPSKSLTKSSSSKTTLASTRSSVPLNVRRAVLEDGETLTALYNSSSLLQRENIIRSFGQTAIKTLIESSVLSLVVETTQGELVGFAAFGDEAPYYVMRVAQENAVAENHARSTQPPATPEMGEPASTLKPERVESDWSEFVRVNYNIAEEAIAAPGGNGLTTFNTTWLRYLLLSEDVSLASNATERILHSLFSTLTQIDQILVSTPISVDPFHPLNDKLKFDELQIRNEITNSAAGNVIQDLGTLRLFISPRAWFLPNLFLRRAKIEDNDDLVPICNSQSDILTEVYGEFYLATLIQNQNQHQHALVAEVNNRACGLLNVTDQVDVKLLQECFDLEEYEQMRKQKTLEQEFEEKSGPTPLSRMNNIFLTIVSNPAPLSQAEKEQRDKSAQMSMVSSKRASYIGKRTSFGGGGLAALAGLLKSQPAAAADGNAAAHTSLSGNLLSPATLTGTGNIREYPENASIPGSGTASPAPQPRSIQIEPATSFPAQWLLNYLETYHPDPAAVARAQEAKYEREQNASDRDGSDTGRSGYSNIADEDGPDEMEEALLLNRDLILARFHQHLHAQVLENQSLNDLIVTVLGALDGTSIGGFLKFLEAAVKVPANMPVRPPPKVLDASIDDGTAQANVFCITLFCLDERYENRSIDILKASFDLYPDRAFCVLTLPHTSSPSSISMLKYFTYIKPTSKNTFSHALYLVHRDTLATMNSLQIHSPSLALPPEATSILSKNPATNSAIANAMKETEATETEKLLTAISPLINHLSNADEIRDLVSSSVTHTLTTLKSKVDGTSELRLKAGTTAGLSGQALLDKKKALELQLLESKTSPSETALISCSGSLVGLMVFNRLSAEELALLRSEFSTDDFISYDDLPAVEVAKSSLPERNRFDPEAPLPKPLEDVTRSSHLNVLTFIINPLWNSQIGFICQEVLRLKKAHVLYYQVWTKPTDSNTTPKVLQSFSSQCGLNVSYRFSNGFIIPQLVDTFIQVRPRRRPAFASHQIQTGLEDVFVLGRHGQDPKDAKSPRAAELAPAPLPCSLHVLSRRLISQPKTVLNSRVVIVGSSTTALSFLETLLLIPDKHYSSVTLLSKDGLISGVSGLGDEPGAQGYHFLPCSLSYSSSWLSRLSFSSRIKIIKNTMINLDSGKKNLLLADGSLLPYDILILTPGLQNQLPLTLMRGILASAVREELASKELLRQRHEEAVRDARRRKKAAEQGLDDTSVLDADALAKLDEELDREAAAAKAKMNRASEDGQEGASQYSSDDEDLESVASFDSKGKAVRRKRSRKHHHGSSAAVNKPSHDSWKRWVTWSSSGLETWEAEYGSLLEKQRLLKEGRLDIESALKRNAEVREYAASEEGLQEGFDPSKLDLIPYGISGIYSLSNEEHVSFLIDSFQKDPQRHSQGGWVVYGVSLDALTAIQGLIELGVSPDLITWAHPLTSTTLVPSANTSLITPSSVAFLQRSSVTANSVAGGDSSPATQQDDPLILHRILTTVQELGCLILSGKRIKNVKQEEGKVYAVILTDVKKKDNAKANEEEKQQSPNGVDEDENDPNAIEIEVVGIIGCGEYDVDPYIFRSVHGSSLVYDGRLVLNHSFQTTIPSIYAAGPVSKFSRKYGSQILQLESYNSVEIGQKLCEAVLRTGLDVSGTLASDAKTAAAKASSKRATSPSKGSKKVKPPATTLPPLGIQPKIIQAFLPGNLLYFHAEIPTHRTIQQPKVLVSGGPSDAKDSNGSVSARTRGERRITRLVFNDYNILHSITILSQPPVGQTSLETFLQVSSSHHLSLVSLIGMPASYMNRILFRFQQKQITDLVDFLSSPWSVALYHESFSQLRSYLHYFLLENRLEIVAILDRIIQLFTTQSSFNGKDHSAGLDGEVVARNEVDSSHGTTVDPFLVSQLTSLLPAHLKDTVQRALLRFLRQHENHLPGYVIPKPFYNGPQAKPRVM